MGFIVGGLLLVCGLTFAFTAPYIGDLKRQIIRAYNNWTDGNEYRFQEIEMITYMNPFGFLNILLTLPSKTKFPEFYKLKNVSEAYAEYKNLKKVFLFGFFGFFVGFALLVTLGSMGYL